jgi:hypothetical protein
MPTPTYTQLNSITLASGVPSVTFSKIPQNYKDLVIVYNGETVSSGNYDITFSLNGDTSNHSIIVVGGSGSSTFSFTAGSINTFNLGAGNKSVGIFNVMDYSAIDKHKHTLIRLNAAAAGTGMCAQRWASNSAVTSVTVGIGSGTLATGSTFTLYGIVG